MSTKTTAFLGPEGSYTELALGSFVETEKKLSCNTIEEVFNKLALKEVDAGFIPIENMLQGSVTETLDLLYKFKNEVYIASSFTYKISHCLGKLPSKNKDIKTIYSKDIALRQCSKLLSKNYSKAALVPTSSTTAAAKKVLDESIKDAAVIAAEQTLKKMGFEIVHKEISDATNNQTRFILLKPGKFNSGNFNSKNCNSKNITDESNLVTSIVVDPGRDRQGLLFEILEVISVKHRCNLNSIHSRPDSKGGFVFHLDLDGGINNSTIEDCLKDLKKYCSQFTGHIAEILVFGSYKQTPFNSNTFSNVGIIGGNGAMGKWFIDFFSNAGLNTFVHDTNYENSLTIKSLCEKSEIIILSVPMSSIDEILEKLTPFLNEKHLLVENCSIKSSVLPQLLTSKNKSFEILGLHTMFGPSVNTIRDQNVIITKTERSNKKATEFENLLYKHGAITTKVALENHDHASAVLQAVIQCTVICLGEFIAENFESKEELETFNTPNSRSIIETVKRIVKQSDTLLSDLQTLNPKAKKIRKDFIKNIETKINSLEKGQTKPLLEAIEKSRLFFFKEDNRG